MTSLAMSHSLEAQAIPLLPMSADTMQQSDDEQPPEPSVGSLHRNSRATEHVELGSVRRSSTDGEESQSLLRSDQTGIRHDSWPRVQETQNDADLIKAESLRMQGHPEAIHSRTRSGTPARRDASGQNGKTVHNVDNTVICGRACRHYQPGLDNCSPFKVPTGSSRRRYLLLRELWNCKHREQCFARRTQHCVRALSRRG